MPDSPLPASDILRRLADTLDARRDAVLADSTRTSDSDPVGRHATPASPAVSDSYSARLLRGGVDAIGKKLGEENAEVLLAAKDCAHEGRQLPVGSAEWDAIAAGAGRTHRSEAQIHLVCEVADWWFHSLVLLAAQHLRPEEVLAELARREGTSGLAEKAARPTRGHQV